MDIYSLKDFEIENKSDKSPLTIADKKANAIICSYLEETDIPVISEENRQLPYEERKKWSKCWIIDPLDGTKEFIKRNGEFTVNIALIENGLPVLGVIYAPALHTLYYAEVKNKKAYRVKVQSRDIETENIVAQAKEIRPHLAGSCVKVVSSRSHMNKETLDFIRNLEKEKREVEVISKGSSLKFCLVAEGEAQIYPRFGPTMEWDTAAGQAICEAVGLICKLRSNGQRMMYNREDPLNGHFIVAHEG